MVYDTPFDSTDRDWAYRNLEKKWFGINQIHPTQEEVNAPVAMLVSTAVLFALFIFAWSFPALVLNWSCCKEEKKIPAEEPAAQEDDGAAWYLTNRAKRPDKPSETK